MLFGFVDLAVMPWYAIPFESSHVKSRLVRMFQICYIPTLILLDPSGYLITRRCREELLLDVFGDNFPWAAPDLIEVITGGYDYISLSSGAVISCGACDSDIVLRSRLPFVFNSSSKRYQLDDFSYFNTSNGIASKNNLSYDTLSEHAKLIQVDLTNKYIMLFFGSSW